MTTTITAGKLAAYLQKLGEKARAAANVLRLSSSQQRKQAIQNMASQIQMTSNTILQANAIDMDKAQNKLNPAMLDRLLLTPQRIEAIASSLTSIANMPDPIGKIDESWTQPNGLKFSKVRTPIGVIGMIYESRPNVTADAASLSLKSANACILRGGSEALHSNTAIHSALLTGIVQSGLPETSIQYVASIDRDAVGHMLGGLGGNIDLIIPRGGKGLVARVQQDARVPVLAHLEGRNHTYIHKDASPDMARDIILNAKMRRTGICGATETLLLDSGALPLLPMLAKQLTAAGCTLKGDEKARSVDDHIAIAREEDYSTEYLDAILNIKIVSGIDSALAHIQTYGSGHTEAIVTDNKDAAQIFLNQVDAAIVMHNTSTQYADGGEFGFGAEIGIATGRLHARGPVGAKHLTSYKYLVHGTGQVRP